MKSESTSEPKAESKPELKIETKLECGSSEKPESLSAKTTDIPAAVGDAPQQIPPAEQTAPV